MPYGRIGAKTAHRRRPDFDPQIDIFSTYPTNQTDPTCTKCLIQPKCPRCLIQPKCPRYLIQPKCPRCLICLIYHDKTGQSSETDSKPPDTTPRVMVGRDSPNRSQAVSETPTPKPVRQSIADTTPAPGASHQGKPPNRSQTVSETPRQGVPLPTADRPERKGRVMGCVKRNVKCLTIRRLLPPCDVPIKGTHAPLYKHKKPPGHCPGGRITRHRLPHTPNQGRRDTLRTLPTGGRSCMSRPRILGAPDGTRSQKCKRPTRGRDGSRHRHSQP